MDTKERLMKFIQEEGMTVSGFERLCGLSNGYIKNSSGNFGTKKIEDILRIFPELNRDWLLSGAGEMKTPLHISQSINGDNNTEVAGNHNFVNNSDILTRAFDEIAAQRKLTEQAINYMTVAQKQTERLITLLEKE